MNHCCSRAAWKEITGSYLSGTGCITLITLFIGYWYYCGCEWGYLLLWSDKALHSSGIHECNIIHRGCCVYIALRTYSCVEDRGLRLLVHFALSNHQISAWHIYQLLDDKSDAHANDDLSYHSECPLNELMYVQWFPLLTKPWCMIILRHQRWKVGVKHKLWFWIHFSYPNKT